MKFKPYPFINQPRNLNYEIVIRGGDSKPKMEKYGK